jgi:hypothetical protein
MSSPLGRANPCVRAVSAPGMHGQHGAAVITGSVKVPGRRMGGAPIGDRALDEGARSAPTWPSGRMAVGHTFMHRHNARHSAVPRTDCGMRGRKVGRRAQARGQIGRRRFTVIGHCHHAVLSSNLTDIGWLWSEQTGRAAPISSTISSWNASAMA